MGCPIGCGLGILATEAIQSAALPFEGIDHVHGCHGLSFCVLCVGYRISDNIFKEDLENTTSFLVDEA